MTRGDARASKDVVEGILCVLIDTGFTHSFILGVFAFQIGIELQLLNFRLCVFTPMINSIIAELVCNSCIVWVED